MWVMRVILTLNTGDAISIKEIVKNADGTSNYKDVGDPIKVTGPQRLDKPVPGHVKNDLDTAAAALFAPATGVTDIRTMFNPNTQRLDAGAVQSTLIKGNKVELSNLMLQMKADMEIMWRAHPEKTASQVAQEITQKYRMEVAAASVTTSLNSKKEVETFMSDKPNGTMVRFNGRLLMKMGPGDYDEVDAKGNAITK